MKSNLNLTQLRNKYGEKNYYNSSQLKKNWYAKHLPSIFFYLKLLFGPVGWLCNKGSKKQCNDIEWVYGSAWCGDIFEETGGRIEIEGKENFAAGAPYIFIANHMSTLETFFLPAILRPYAPVTFVVKKSLTTMPFFGPVMRSRNPIVVGRKNPREDLMAVLDGGCERINQGISIVVFPQSTRSLNFSREHFNTIGIKLARKTGAPVIPLALKTDAWGQGKRIKELGKIRPDIPVHFKFGQSIRITGNGKKEHEQICDFIETNLSNWIKQDGINQ